MIGITFSLDFKVILSLYNSDLSELIGNTVIPT